MILVIFLLFNIKRNWKKIEKEEKKSNKKKKRDYFLRSFLHYRLMKNNPLIPTKITKKPKTHNRQNNQRKK